MSELAQTFYANILWTRREQSIKQQTKYVRGAGTSFIFHAEFTTDYREIENYM